MRMPSPDFGINKLGGPGKVVQIDETMLNFKCKSHRGRSPKNRTDALCIVEVSSGIQRVFATIIPDKKATTMIPIICTQVASNSIIWTDDHRSYNIISRCDFTHNTVCHKYEFINHSTLVNT
ncbi:MAG: transposase [Aeromonas sp.]